MNCKPGQMALIVRASVMEPCSAMRLGVPVTVVSVALPRSLRDLAAEQIEGPAWTLAEPLRCPHGQAGCDGIRRMPDSCLRPFDPESAPESVAETATVQDERLLTVDVPPTA